MSYNSVVISSGHGKYVPGAIGILDEHKEAVRMVNALEDMLRQRGVDVTTYEDVVSKTQNENLNRIVDFHNSQTRELDVSIHFNAYVETSQPMGTEVLYVTQQTLAKQLSFVIADTGAFINRGPKKRTDLFFLNNTSMPAVLVEVCFVDSEADAELYEENFEEICEAIAEELGGEGDWPAPEPEPDTVFQVTGKVSQFGGPDDPGVSPSEPLAFATLENAPHLFLPYQPEGTTGLARRLNSKAVNYLACRWNYEETPREMLLSRQAAVRSVRTGRTTRAWPADWGPAGPESDHDTGRVTDLSPALMQDLDLETDDMVEVIFPAPED